MFGADKGAASRLEGRKLVIGIVQARFNQGVTNALAKACWDELLARGVEETTSSTCRSPVRWKCRWRCRPWRKKAATTR